MRPDNKRLMRNTDITMESKRRPTDWNKSPLSVKDYNRFVVFIKIGSNMSWERATITNPSATINRMDRRGIPIIMGTRKNELHLCTNTRSRTELNVYTYRCIRIALIGTVSRNQEDNIQIVEEIPYCVAHYVCEPLHKQEVAMRFVYPYITKHKQIHFLLFIDDGKCDV